MAFDDTRRPSVTELPGLTSDPICTADRRGGILISSGPDCFPGRVINPSRRERDRGGPLLRSVLQAGRSRLRPGHVRITSECPVPLKGVGTTTAGRCPGTARYVRTSAGVDPASLRITSDGWGILKTVESMTATSCDFMGQRPNQRGYTNGRYLGSSRRRHRNGSVTRDSSCCLVNVAWQEGSQSSRASCARCGRVGATRLFLATAEPCRPRKRTTTDSSGVSSDNSGGVSS